MSLLSEGRRIYDTFVRQRMTRLDRSVFHARHEKFFPSRQQLAHLDMFLSKWERLVFSGASALAIISVIGLFWSFQRFNMVTVPTTGGTFKEALVGEPQNINPLFAATDIDLSLTNVLFLPLCADAGPALATCKFNSTLTRATITLGDHEWHDGAAITAQDVLFTIQAMQNTAVGSPWQPAAQKITAVAAADGTVQISVAHSMPDLPALLHVGIIPEHIWKNVDPTHMRTDSLNLKPVGSGPFQFESATADAGGFLQSMTFDVFSDFKPKPAYIEELTFRFAPDADTAADLFRSRTVDAFTAFDPSADDTIFKHDVKRYEITPPTVVSLFFNPSKNPLFKNPDLRDAIALAIDRTAIVKNALKSNGVPAREPFPASIIGGDLAALPDMNTANALALLKKANVKLPTTPLSLGVPSSAALVNAANQIVENLKAIGLPVATRTVDLENAPQDAATQDMLLAGQSYETPNSAYPYWNSTGSADDGVNYARYQMSEVDAWLQSLLSEPAPATRATLLKKISNRIVADTPAIFLYQPVYEYFVAQKVQGVTVPPGVNADERFQNITSWFISTKQVKK